MVIVIVETIVAIAVSTGVKIGTGEIPATWLTIHTKFVSLGS